MIDVKFNEAMQPLVIAMNSKRPPPPIDGSPRASNYYAQAAAVVEALGIPAQFVASPTFRYVLAFAVEMEKRLGLPENRAKGDRDGWLRASPRQLLTLGGHQLGSLDAEIDNALDDRRELNLEEVLKRAANAGNYLMMLADRSGALKVPANGSQLPPIREDEPEAVTEPGEPTFPTEQTIQLGLPRDQALAAYRERVSKLPRLAGFNSPAVVEEPQDGDDPMRTSSDEAVPEKFL